MKLEDILIITIFTCITFMLYFLSGVLLYAGAYFMGICIFLTGVFMSGPVVCTIKEVFRNEK